ncbi:MAG: hypothetical protein IKG76_06560 [Firmicutes bacterium]|nr:hypothetical protein [Bacillota bacterium]
MYINHPGRMILQPPLHTKASSRSRRLLFFVFAPQMGRGSLGKNLKKLLDSLLRQRYNTDNFIPNKPVRKSSNLHKRTIQRASGGESEAESRKRMDF